MKTTIKKTLQGLLLIPMLALGVSAAAPIFGTDMVSAQVDPKASIEQGVVSAGGGSGSTGDSLKGMIQTVVTTLLFIVGAVSVIMIIYGGFRYVTSGGDSNSVTSAKNTILYAVIGLVVALLSYAIVGYVLGTLGG